MYESFFGFREKPFSLIPDPDFLYLSRLHKAALNMLEYGLRGEAGFTLISGEVGSGKTILVRRFLKMVDQNTTVGLITNTHSSIGNLLEWILLAFGLDYRGMEKVELYHVFSEFLNELQTEGRRAILIIDEAQNMELETLEELRMLSNINADKNLVLQIVLVGQPEILEKLNRPEMRQMTQRISVTFRLWPLTFAETCGYIRHRVKVAGGDPNTFDNSACGAIYHFTEGLPRPVNILCDAALVYGFGEGKHVIDIDTILDVIDDRQRSGLQPFSRMDKDFDRDALVETISELVETYGTPEMLEEATSLPSEESSFVADEYEDEDEVRYGADNVAPFVDSSGYDDGLAERDTKARYAGREDSPGRHLAEDDQDGSQMDVEDQDAEADWRDSVAENHEAESGKRRSSFGRWVAIIALICVGVAGAVYALPYIKSFSESSGTPSGAQMESDLVKRLSEMNGEDAVVDESPSDSAAANSTPESGMGQAQSNQGDGGEENVNGGTVADDQQTASRPISVEVIEYDTPVETPSTDVSANDGASGLDSDSTMTPGEATTVASAGTETNLPTTDVSSGDTATAGEGAPIETDAGTAGAADVAASDSAVQRASQDLLRLSGVDSDIVVGEGGLPFSNVRGDLSSALGALFGEWSLDYSTAQGTSPCGKALRNGLRCFEENGDWKLVRELNRPSLISLDAPDGRQIHAVLTSLDGNMASLLIDGRIQQVNVDSLTPYWNGDFLLLWRPPTVYRRLLREGLRGDDVVWLRNQLAKANGSTPRSQDAIIFDDALKREVLAFQRSRGLNVDGMVGSETLVHLGAINRQAGEPVLNDRIL